jgi:hypothetical protein
VSDLPEHPESLDTNSMLLGLVVAAATDSIITGGLFGVICRQIGKWSWDAAHQAAVENVQDEDPRIRARSQKMNPQTSN